MLSNDPFGPDTRPLRSRILRPVPRLKDRRAFVFSITRVMAAGAVTALSFAACANTDPPPTAENIVDVWFADPAQKLQFCDEYARRPELAGKSFKEDFEEIDGNPSADEIFDEAASRC
jgi:hypothetical protein